MRDLLSEAEVGHEGDVGLTVPVEHPLPVHLILPLVVQGVQVKEGWIQLGQHQGVEQSGRGEHLPARDRAQFMTRK